MYGIKAGLWKVLLNLTMYEKIYISQIYNNSNNLRGISQCSWEAERNLQLSLFEKVIKEGTDKKCRESITESC